MRAADLHSIALFDGLGDDRLAELAAAGEDVSFRARDDSGVYLATGRVTAAGHALRVPAPALRDLARAPAWAWTSPAASSSTPTGTVLRVRLPPRIPAGT